MTFLANEFTIGSFYKRLCTFRWTFSDSRLMPMLAGMAYSVYWRGRTIRASIYGTAKGYFFLRNIAAKSGAGPPSYSKGVGILSPGMKLPWRETGPSPPSIAEIQNKWSYTATPSACLHGVDRESFTFTRVMSARFLLTLTRNQNDTFNRSVSVGLRCENYNSNTIATNGIKKKGSFLRVLICQ